jgi:hypothetical protein
MWRKFAELVLGHTPRGLSPSSADEADVSSLDRAPDDLESRPWRTVGLTEQRLREKNRQAWRTSGKGWSEMLGRFSRSGT